MARITADTADDARSEVLALGTVILAMANLTAILASLVLVVAECTVEGSQLAQLFALEFVLSLGDRGGLQVG